MKPIILTTNELMDVFNGVRNTVRRLSQKYCSGDVLYVQELWGVGCRPDCSCGWVDGIEYKVDCEYVDEWDSLPLYHANKEELLELFESDDIGEWRSASTMPQEAARLFLKIKSIEPECYRDKMCVLIEFEVMDERQARKESA